MYNYSKLIFLSLTLQWACSQNIPGTSYLEGQELHVGGPCDGCYLMHVGMPDQLNHVDTSDGWKESTERLLLTGKVLNRDGSPQAGIIIYYWQTDSKGYYSPGDNMLKEAQAHGHIRGWVKSDDQGDYRIFTSMPAPYPGRNSPAHIHLLVKEPEINEYWIDEVVFDDDELLTKELRKEAENRGGTGLVRLVNGPDFQVAEKNIILGLNVPDHPNNYDGSGKDSGLSIGEDQPSFTPFHAWGPDRGSVACPVCKYGRYHGIIYFAGEEEEWPNVSLWLELLEEETKLRGNHLKVYFVWGSEEDYDFEKRKLELEKMGQDLGLKNVALTFIPSFFDEKSEIYRSRINPEFKNTFIIYRHRNIVGKFTNLSSPLHDFTKIQEALDETMSPYFEWEAVH